MLDAGAKVIDLSGAFRLRRCRHLFALVQGKAHRARAARRSGLRPARILPRSASPQARLIANPGLLSDRRQPGHPAADRERRDRPHRRNRLRRASPASAAPAAKPSLKTSFCEVTDNFSAYSVLDHRHVPEVLMVSGLEEPELSFTAQLLPIDRGILETIYFRARESHERRRTARHLSPPLSEREPSCGSTRLAPCPTSAASTRTNFCDIGLKFDPATGRAVVVSAIDNLVKGAAGQAIQNMNLVLGFDETEGLL